MIYYVEDDTNIRELALYALRQAGLEVRGFSEADAFWEALGRAKPELVMLDIMLPGESGLDILRRLRSHEGTAYIPVMMLTAKGTEYDKVIGLDAGADDYLVKPFGMMELVSRCKALIRRAAAPTVASSGEPEVKCGPVVLSPQARKVSVGDAHLDLTVKEFDLLKTLMEHAGTVLTREVLLELVWDITFVGETRTVDVHVQTLRRKLSEAHPGAESFIRTVRGVGYSFDSEAGR